MKTAKTFISIFWLTFLIGYASVSLTKKSVPIRSNSEVSKEIFVLSDKPLSQEEIILYSSAKNFGGSELLDEDYYEENPKYEFKMLETGEFHGDEVNAKSGETWLGFFAENGNLFLRKTKIGVRRVHDAIVDDDNPKRKTGIKVSVKSKTAPMFLLKNADFLKEGGVKTLFKGVTSHEAGEASEIKRYPTDIRKGFVQNYQIGGKSYTLRVVKVFSKQANINFALILEKEKTKQILHVSREDDYLGTIYWVGDIDRDNKPDFFLSPWIQENVSESSLFLSSKADKKNLVKKVSSLRTTGC